MAQSSMSALTSASDPPALGEYAIHTAWEGFANILHRPSGEIMHSRTEPMVEAVRVYVQQADLAARLRRPAKEGPLVLWDVGLGAAANAMAAIHCYEGLAETGSPPRPLQIISFENDIDSLRLACTHPERFAYLRHPAPTALLENGCWNSEQHAGLGWELVPGDFAETMTAAPGPPEVIFYDMFSPKTCGIAWTSTTFRRLFKCCAETRTVLCTYTLSTASRAAMLAAGFWVVRGRTAGAKEETTIALSPAEARELPAGAVQFLGAEWLRKWERSKAKFPANLSPEEHATFESSIRTHPQFAAIELPHGGAARRSA